MLDDEDAKLVYQYAKEPTRELRAKLLVIYNQWPKPTKISPEFGFLCEIFSRSPCHIMRSVYCRAIIEKYEKQGWRVDVAKCRMCGHEHVAVFPAGIIDEEMLQCPSCKHQTSVQKE